MTRNQKTGSSPDPVRKQVWSMANAVLATLTKHTHGPLLKLDMRAFRTAFAAVAHEIGIFHSENRGSYNFFFGEVRSEVSRRIARTRAKCKKAKPVEPAQLPLLTA